MVTVPETAVYDGGEIRVGSEWLCRVDACPTDSVNIAFI